MNVPLQPARPPQAPGRARSETLGRVGPPLTATAIVVGNEREIASLAESVARRVTASDKPLRYGRAFRFAEIGASFELTSPDGIKALLTCAPATANASDSDESPDQAYAITLNLIGPQERISPTRATALLDTVRHLPFTGSEITLLTSEMPVTRTLPSLLPGKPLADCSAIFTIHHMTDFLVMVDAAIGLGIRPDRITVVDKEYHYRFRDRVDAHLRHVVGSAVHPYRLIEAGLRLHFARARRAGLRTLILDDGGYVLPRLLEGVVPELDPAEDIIGVVEQTMSGIWRLEPFRDSLPVPIFSVAESELKATIESYGVADACVRSVLSLLPNEKFEGRRAAVIGFGRIGREVAEILRQRRMQVAISDPSMIALIGARERGFVTYQSVSEMVATHRPLIVYGCGGRGAMGGDDFRAIRRDCYLVSTSSRNYEYDVEALAEQAIASRPVSDIGRRFTLPNDADVTLVADGYPINFHLAESMPNRYSDLVLSSMLIGACALQGSPDRFRPGHNLAETNAVLAAAPTTALYYDLYSD